MIPILYPANETSFLSNGIGRLVDCLRCEVTEERNGIFEVEFDYPITGQHYSDIVEGRIIAVIHDDNKDVQPFDIYARSAPIDGVVTFYAHHISYRLQYSILQPFTASSASAAFGLMASKCVTPCPFTFWTDKTANGTFTVSVPVSVKEILGGVQGSILDVFGKGEYEWDKFTVNLHLNRGTDTGVQIRYGKNLVNLTQDVDTSGFYSAVVPFWRGGDDDSTLVTLPEWVVLSTVATQGTVPTSAVPLDLSDQWEEVPTEAQLRAKAQERVNSAEAWLPDENIKVDFVALWQTEEYANVAPLERLKLCDRVDVIHPDLGLVAESQQIVKVVYDALLERYSSMEIGSARTSFASVVQAATEAAILPQVPTKSFLAAAIDAATDEITGADGGNFVFTFDANGKPTGFAIMDADNIESAVNVWRFTAGGLGHSSNGFNGPFNDVALTASGKINADLITVGTLLANIIHGGTLTLGGFDNGNGVLVVLDADGTEVGRLDNTGANITGNIKMLSRFYDSGASAYIDNQAIMGDAIYISGYSNNGIVFSTSKGFIVKRESSGSINSSYSVVPLNGRLIECATATNSFSKIMALTSSITGSQDISFFEWAYGNNGKASLAYVPSSSGTSNGWKLELSSSYFSAPGLVVNVNDGASMYVGKPSSTSSQKLLIENGNDSFVKFRYSSGVGTITLKEQTTEIIVGTTISITTSNSKTFESRGNNLYFNNNELAFVSSSSRRYKHNISHLVSKNLDPHKLYQLTPVQFEYNEGHPLQYADMKGQILPGFIAEDIAEIYPAAVIYGKDGKIESWDERRIIPGLLALVQEQKAIIDALTKRIERLEYLIRGYADA